MSLMKNIISFFLERKFHMLIFYVILVFSFKGQILDKPLWWHEEAYAEGAIRTYENGLNPFVEFHAYKPPPFFSLLLWGINYSVSRL